MTQLLPRERWQADTIRCEMCGREAGQVVRHVFFQRPTGPAPRRRGGISCCGQCGGHLGAFSDALAAYVAERLPRETPWYGADDGRRGQVAARRAG